MVVKIEWPDPNRIAAPFFLASMVTLCIASLTFTALWPQVADMVKAHKQFKQEEKEMIKAKEKEITQAKRMGDAMAEALWPMLEDVIDKMMSVQV